MSWVRVMISWCVGFNVFLWKYHCTCSDEYLLISVNKTSLQKVATFDHYLVNNNEGDETLLNFSVWFFKTVDIYNQQSVSYALLRQNLDSYWLIRLRVSRRRREMYCGHARLSVRGSMPTLLHGPGCNFGEWCFFTGCSQWLVFISVLWHCWLNGGNDMQHVTNPATVPSRITSRTSWRTSRRKWTSQSSLGSRGTAPDLV